MLTWKEVGKLLLILTLGALLGLAAGALSLHVEGRDQPTLGALLHTAPWR